jgi:Cu2+-exporting ATPase
MLASAGHLARSGVWVRELQSLQALAEVDTVVFDKTGTLTQDGQRVQMVHTRDGAWLPEQAQEVMAQAAALACHSWHPVSRTLVAAAPDHPRATSVTEHTGQGLEGQVLDDAGQRWHLRLGSLSFCSAFGAGLACPPHAAQCTVHVFEAQRGWLASFDLAEDLRADAASAVRQLSNLGLEVWILSGDRQIAVDRVAQWVGVPASHAMGQCSPQDKLHRVRQLQALGKKVWMVGDGMNDGPVLASAQVSLALGSAVPLAQARSDLVMMGSQLLQLPALLRRARKTMRVVRHNLTWALAYNVLMVPLALGGDLPAWLAGLGMALSSLLVIAYSLILARDMPGEITLKGA